MSYAAATQAGTNSNNKIQDQQYRFEVRMRGLCLKVFLFGHKAKIFYSELQ